MDVYWDGLNRHIHGCDPAKVLDWCRREQLEYSTPAALLHYMLCWRELVQTDLVPEENRRVLDKYQRKPLPKPSDPVEQWRELLEWRHPRMDLNLLQLAVIFNVPCCMPYLGQPIFMRAEGYRGRTVPSACSSWFGIRLLSIHVEYSLSFSCMV